MAASFRILLLIMFFLTSGCADLSYYLHSVKGHYSILQKTRDIDDLLVDEKTDPELVERLRLVGRIRDFAINQLHLPKSDSYTLYADLGRSYALKNLFAAEEFSVTAHRWCYPLVGCAGYRGYFDEQRLDRFVAELKQKNFDIYVANVSAYSTLGWFDDPVLNTFINWPEYRLAGLIFHELSHQRLYIDGDSRFNESFAVAVQQAGVEQWLQSTGQHQKLKRYQQHLVNRQQVIQLIEQARNDLKALYIKDLNEHQKRTEKQQILQQLKSNYEKLSSGFKVPDGFKYWFKGTMNNARLASVSTYNARVPAFKNILQSLDVNFQLFFQHVEHLSEMPEGERNGCLDYWRADQTVQLSPDENRSC